jgi:hypothetical protein
MNYPISTARHSLLALVSGYAFLLDSHISTGLERSAFE